MGRKCNICLENKVENSSNHHCNKCKGKMNDSWWTAYHERNKILKKEKDGK